MCEIFISHIHEDEKVASAIGSFLGDKLLEVNSYGNSANVKNISGSRTQIFYSADQFQIRLGDDWLEKIHSALNSAKVVIALFSDAALTRPWLHFEAGGAWFAGKKLMPVCLGSIHPENLPKPYSNIQGCNLHDRSAPYYLYQSVFSALHPGGICLPPSFTDDKEQRLREVLSGWQENVVTVQI